MDLMKDLSEIVHYENSKVPLYIRTVKLSIFPDMSAACHWHDDVEWIHVTQGTMCYFVSGKRLLLHEGDVLMVNSRQMHYGYSYQKQDSHFLCVFFNPTLFCQNQHLFQKYVTSVLESDSFTYLHFDAGHPLRQEMSECLTRIVNLKQGGEEAYEMEVIAIMHTVWGRLWQNHELRPAQDGQEIQNDLDIQKDMVSFIYSHYGEKISLDEIAASGNVSRSKCCRIFKRYLQQSPVDFLNEYRLKVSRHMLDNSDKNITEIALACGFNHLSYYSKFFCEAYGSTPSDYRKCRENSFTPSE